jgi:hypothetical protein
MTISILPHRLSQDLVCQVMKIDGVDHCLENEMKLMVQKKHNVYHMSLVKNSPISIEFFE